MKKVLIIGGAGYVGSELTPLLLDNNFRVSVYDLFIYGETIHAHPNLELIKGDIRDLKKLEQVIVDFDAVIHLACISNDPSFDLNPDLGKSVNYDCFEPMIKICKNSGVKRFIYASSSSVYGVKNETNVNENFSLEPLTDYSKYKAMCEEVLLKYSNKDFVCCIVRPATVCGVSKRQRMDLVVNILSNLAYNTGIIKVFGGDQLRPNINIKDMCNAYLHILNTDEELISNEIFNVGFENLSVRNLANLVKSVIGDKIEIKSESTNDNRSYHISSEKIKDKLFFYTKYNIKNAIEDLNIAFQKNLFTNPLDNEMYFNIKRMNSIKLK